MSEFVPIASPCLDGNERKYVEECLDSTWISSTGRFIGLFEQAFADYCGVKYAVSTNSGTSALHLALLALGVHCGDEVVVPTLTYVATANAVLYCGGTPIFVDAEPVTMNLDIRRVESLITAKTKGIIPVHLFGHPVDMDPLLEVAERYNLWLLEDAAEAHGAVYKGRKVGSIGAAATFSFYGNKIITTGEGGMVTTNDGALADKMRLLRGQGMDPLRRYWFPTVGYNYRMTNVAAAIGLAQLEGIAVRLQERRNTAFRYRQSLSHLDLVLSLPSEESWACHAYWAYPISLKPTAKISRDQVMAHLLASGIETRPVFCPMHQLPTYAKGGLTFPVADECSTRGILLPMHGNLTPGSITRIVDALAEICSVTPAGRSVTPSRPCRS